MRDSLSSLTSSPSCGTNVCRYLEALGVRAVAFGSLTEAADAGHAVASEARGGLPEVLLLAVDVAPRADLARKTSGGGARTEGDGDAAAAGGAGGGGFSPGVGEIAEVAKRGWRRCVLSEPPCTLFRVAYYKAEVCVTCRAPRFTESHISTRSSCGVCISPAMSSS